MRFTFLDASVGKLSTGGLMLLALLASGGCFRHSQSDQFYMLQAADGPAPSSVGRPGLLVGVGPVRIPAYLDRPQIVMAMSGPEYHLSEEHRWAERLDENIARVSAQNLARFIPTDRILIHPWPREPRPDVQVSLTLEEMHVDPSGQARFEALWALRYGKNQVTTRPFSCRQPASTTDYAVVVEAQSQCLTRLNRAIADAIQGLALTP